MSDALKYSFTYDSEPTDEQLELLMKEVSAEAKRKAYFCCQSVLL
jgi:inosine/xanthosine triphosphate pyrophosphatase family protein